MFYILGDTELLRGTVERTRTYSIIDYSDLIVEELTGWEVYSAVETLGISKFPQLEQRFVGVLGIIPCEYCMHALDDDGAEDIVNNAQSVFRFKQQRNSFDITFLKTGKTYQFRHSKRLMSLNGKNFLKYKNSEDFIDNDSVDVYLRSIYKAMLSKDKESGFYRITIAFMCGAEPLGYIVVYVDEETEEVCGVLSPLLNTKQDDYLFEYEDYRVYSMAKFPPSPAVKRLNGFVAQYKLSGLEPYHLFV